MPRAIFDPRMADRLAVFYPSTGTLQTNTPTRDPDSGELVDSWADDPSYTDLACAVAPAKGKEIRTSDETVAIADWTISSFTDLSGAEPAQRIVITAGPNAGTYEILAVQTDSHGATSRIQARMVT